MIKCPQCFSTLTHDRKAWTCDAAGCSVADLDATASTYAGYGVRSRPAYADTQADHAQRVRDGKARGTWPPPDPTCRSCGDPMSEMCPTCRFVLPAHWGDGDVTCVVLSGARASGKSLFIAMGVEKLERLLLEHANSQMQPTSPEIAQVFHVNYDVPLKEGTVLQSTPMAAAPGAYQRVPLVFDLGSIRGRRQFVVLRDVAGEDMQNLPQQRAHFSYFGRADAVLFLFDPLASPDVRANLEGIIPLPNDLGHDPARVMHNVLTLVREGSVGRPAPPVGVVVSKFDALEEFRALGEEKPQWSELMSHRGAAFARDASDRSLHYDHVDGDLLNAEIRSLLLRLGGAGVVAMLENPADGRPIASRYFAVSVLGHAPRGDRLDERGKAPFRAVDPLKWALSLTGAI